MKSLFRAALFAAGAVLALAPAARADNFEEFGFGARAQAMGGAFTALASDMTAAHYNPGGLIFSRHINLTAGFSYGHYMLSFDSEAGGPRDGAAERIPPLSAFTVGVSSTIPFDVPDRFAFGLGVFLPTRGLVDLQATTDGSEPDFFRYGERHDRLHLVAAGAVKATDWLSFGLGASVFVDGSGSTDASLDDVEFGLRLEPDAGLIAGVLLMPADWISFGVTYRSEISFKLEFPVNVQGAALLDLETITFFTPHQVVVGTAVNVGESLLFTFDLGWYHWSRYDSPFLVVSGGGTVLTERVRMRDVVSPKLGVEAVAADWLVLRGGYAFRTSPVPDQDGEPTALVDGPKHTFTLGCGLSFGKQPQAVSEAARPEEAAPAETIEQALGDASFDVDLFMQIHWHPTISADQSGLGEWEAGGVILNLGFNVTTRF